MPKVATDSFFDSRLSDRFFESLLDGALAQMMPPGGPRTGILGKGMGGKDILPNRFAIGRWALFS